VRTSRLILALAGTGIALLGAAGVAVWAAIPAIIRE
jgi:hypothetical protein